MGQNVSTALLGASNESKATHRTPATRPYLIVNSDELDILDEIGESAPPHISAPLYPFVFVQDQSRFAGVPFQKLPDVGRSRRFRAGEACAALLEEEQREEVESVTANNFTSDLGHELLLWYEARFHGAFARGFRIPPPLKATEKYCMEANFSAFRASLQSLGQSEPEDYDAKDKALFQAVAAMSETLESDWEKLQKMELSFKEANEHSERRQNDDRQYIRSKEDFVHELVERLESPPSYALKRRIDDMEKSNIHLERRAHCLRSEIRGLEKEMKELRAQLEEK
ncbi:hypothetical protein SCHPADRAFT_1000512 [Schizopora paradoxa]|uniref:Uncharacterized protein n=1 Tax=Schizopora paradoxa TaxID=27342 RepID=A0A0H2RC68_9AGAM|nr:hypothetical protein SCHPADRAFT_1000512 [Schizopora paradoxa]